VIGLVGVCDTEAPVGDNASGFGLVYGDSCIDNGLDGEVGRYFTYLSKIYGMDG
jgi:hypothetical protein